MRAPSCLHSFDIRVRPQASVPMPVLSRGISMTKKRARRHPRIARTRSSRLAPSRRIVRRLVKECKIMQSRAEALLNSALEYLTDHDVFGPQYEKLLKADIRALKHAVASAE